VVRLCGYTLSRIAWDIMNIHHALDRELDRALAGRGYDVNKLKEVTYRLEDLVNIIRFMYPACPALRLDDVNSWKSDLSRVLGGLREALEKGVEEDVIVALLQATSETGGLLMRINNAFTMR
jgi:hypothetical protein